MDHYKLSSLIVPKVYECGAEPVPNTLVLIVITEK